MYCISKVYTYISGMNNEIRTKLEKEVKTKRVQLWLQISEEVWGAVVKSERLLSASDLSDKELGCLASDLKGGMKEGRLREDMEARLFLWEC